MTLDFRCRHCDQLVPAGVAHVCTGRPQILPPTGTVCYFCGKVNGMDDICHCPGAIEDRASLPVMDEPDNFHAPSPNAPDAPDVPTGKTPFHLADLDFLAAMCDNYRDGIKDGRTANGWKGMQWDDEHREEYAAKILRHLHRYTQTGDPSDLAAVACNANILWHHARKEKKQ